MKALTLRLPDELHEALRQEAFAERTSVTALIVAALCEPGRFASSGCDVCGRPHVMVSTPGGIRFCESHAPEQFEPGACEGHACCTARLHVHGCYADLDGSQCDDPSDHPVQADGSDDA